jgi:hydrogenase maturation protease
VEELIEMDHLGTFPSGIALVIGFGNTLRGDDGVGPHVAAVAASWGLPGLQSIAVAQLTPELAEALAAVELAIFVDARLDHGKEMIEVSPLVPSNSGEMSGHACDPRFLLALAQAVYGCQPRAWLITIPAEDFALGESFSPIARRGAEAALKQISALIGVDPRAIRSLEHLFV